MTPRASPEALRRKGATLYQAGRYAEALALFERVDETAEDYANRGAALRRLRRLDEAETQYRKAIERDPACAAAHANLGNLLADQDRLLEACACYRAAVEHKPGFASAWNGLGTVLLRQTHFHDAIQAFETAARHHPTWAEPHINTGLALLGLAQYDQAETALRRALALDPQHATTHGNLGALYLRAGCPVAAEAACRAAMALAPAEIRWLANLAVALGMQARHAEAETCHRRVMQQQPDYAVGHGNLLFALNYRCDLSAEQIFAEYRAWDCRHARPLLPPTLHFANDPSPERKLRIGYVSPDFRDHAAALFAEPLLAAHDRARFTIYCYSDVVVQDAVTARFCALADHWRSVVGASDAELANIIRRDRIDVLVDLAGHSAGNRLLAFARKPAPVQVSYLLGHGYTTGLSAMDAFLADPTLVPPEADALFSERVVRLPRIPLAYRPPEHMPPVAPLPALTRGHVTFGYFGRTERLNEAVIEAWARIIHGVPGSRLFLNNRPFQEAAFRRRITDWFARHGIEAERLELVFTSPQSQTWAAYGEIDIALDPFPHNAGTTTMEALWLGVPVVTLASRPTVGRFGAAILHAIGFDDWIVADPDVYVARAIRAATDLAGLAQLRMRLRESFAASPLLDATGLARTIEDAYRALWQGWREVDSYQLERAYAAGDVATAKSLATSILTRHPADPAAHHVLGLIAYRDKDLRTADSHLQIARQGRPAHVEPASNHAAVLRALGRLQEAEAAARAALALQPTYVAAHNNLGNILRDAGRYDDSAACYERALQIAPRFSDAWVNLAWVLALAGNAHRAAHAARQAIQCDPNNADGHNNLGLALMRQGQLAEAEIALRRALELRPDFALPHSNVLFCCNYREDLTAKDIFAEYLRWDRQHARALLPAEMTHDLDRTPGRRLRIGYVSPDFRQHAVALFVEPLLAAHDKSEVEVYCYAEVPAPDQVTARFRGIVEHWRSTVGLSDADMAALVRRDRIDVLIDLAGHTAGNRLLVFARKPAPIQVSYLLGHGYTSGLSAIDAFLADNQLAPPEAAHLFSERVIRLPRIPLAYQPPAAMPDVARLPARSQGHVTFGYFGRTVRLNDSVIAAWAHILQQTPGARLMLNSAPFAEAAGREQMLARFAAVGVAADRLHLVFTAPQERTWTAYSEVDIALDPFPHNAGTTTIEALWQGVPVVTLAGRPTVGRFGAAILHAVGLTDWVTDSVDAYVERATLAAIDLDRLEQLRNGLRDRFVASPLRDAAGLAREMEAVYRQLWETWRSGDAARARRLYASGDHTGAADAAKRILTHDPSQPEALHIQGLIALDRGDALAAAELLARSIGSQPSAAALSDLGVVLRTQGCLTEAETAYRTAIQRDPALIDAQGNLGNVLNDLHRHAEARDVFLAAIERAPHLAWLQHGLALSLLGCGEAGRAEAVLRDTLSHHPGDAELHATLAALLGQSGRPIEAETHHRVALPGMQQRERGLNNLALVLQAQGRHQEAEACLREAITLRPDYAAADSNLLFALNYSVERQPAAIYAEYQTWDRRHAMPLAGHRPLPREPRRNRRLRVGYLSPDFRRHAVAFFAGPLLAAHDHTAVELFCYADVPLPDPITGHFRSLADHWRDIVGRSDEAVAEMVREDGIDVLVDLAGHSAGNRLLVFARRPAPVQVSYLLGHGYTTGLSAMDAFLANDDLVPPGGDALFSERVIRLDRIPIAYAPPDGMPPVAPLPAATRGGISFGYFGRPERLNQAVCATWARIVLAVPGSRIVLNTAALQETAFRDLLAARFAAFGIPRARLQFRHTAPEVETWAAYGEIDIALDPFPHNAGTTTIEALWQGVPVLSLVGRPSVGRFGAMILRAVGLHDWVVDTQDAYVQCVTAIAADLPMLARRRQTLRAQVARSPLCDPSGLTRAIESTFRLLRDGASAAVASRTAAA